MQSCNRKIGEVSMEISTHLCSRFGRLNSHQPLALVRLISELSSPYGPPPLDHLPRWVMLGNGQLCKLHTMQCHQWKQGGRGMKLEWQGWIQLDVALPQWNLEFFPTFP
jgi:hypothetical protein